MNGENYEDRASCTVPDPTPEPSPPPPPSGETISPGTAAAISVVAVISFMVFVLVIQNLIKKTSNAQGNQSSDPGSNEEMRRTSKSTTLEESDTQAPVAVEPGNTGVSNSNTNGGILEGGTVPWSIREAFEILDRDQKKNLEKRLENVRR